MTIFLKRAINKIILGVLKKINLAEIIPFEPKSLKMIEESGNLIKL